MTTPEASVKKRIKEALNERRVFYWMPGAAIYGRSGVSDFLCCIHGRLLAIEAKATKHDKPTYLQQQFLDAVSEAGGTALVIHSTNFEVLPMTLRQLGAVKQEDQPTR